MNRFNNEEILREIINELRNICNFSDFIKIKDNLINKLELVERNIRNIYKVKNDNFGEYLSKANEYISQYKPKNGYSKGYSNLFNIPKQIENIQNYNNDIINYKNYEIENNYNRNENINLKNDNYQTPNKIINNSNQNNTINYSYNYNLQNDYNYPNQNIINNIEIETPTQLSPPKKIEYNSQEIKTLYQNKNINNYINNYNIPKFNNNQNQIYQFIDNNDDNNYDPTPSLKRYLAENKNKIEYKFLSDEQLSNNSIQNNEKEKRISNIIIKINKNEEIYELLKKLFSDDLIEKIMDKNCSDNYLTKIEETIKQIEILQKKDEENEMKKNESYTFQTINNNEKIPNQKKKLPKRAQLKSKKGNFSSSSLKKYTNNNNTIGYNINNSGINILNYSQNYSLPKNKKKSYADELLLSHGLPIGKITNENNIKTIQYQPIKNRSFNK